MHRVHAFNIIITIIFLFIMPQFVSAQFSSARAGASVGLGTIKGESTGQTSLSTSLNFSFKHDWTGDILIGLEYLYARKINYFLPENREGRYYPWIQSVSVTGSIEQYIAHKIFMEEGVGVVFLNDKTFSDVDEWDIGVTVKLLVGIDLRKYELRGFRIGVGAQFAETFTNTTASYYILNFQTEYYF